MALIKCPECKKKISDQCESCPNCGYPIKASLANYDAITINTDTANETINATDKATLKTPISKRLWFWIVIAAVVVAATVTVIFLLNSEVKPKVDENGNPVFVDLTDVVYTNADEYLGYYVNVKGKVFQNLGDNGEVKGVQVWIDPDNCEQNLMIHYTSDGSYKDGDYIICTGYIKEIHTYTNTYGTELSVPLIYSTDLRSASYIEVMAPTVSMITPENLTYEKYGYSITVDKIEFAENETRLYMTATNNGSATMYVDADSSVIIQDGNQYNSETNYEADYEEVPYNLSKGTTVSGIVAFPAIADGGFEYVIEMHSDNFDERFETITFKISKEVSSVFVPVDEPNTVWNFEDLKYETKGYTIQIDKVEFYDNETRIYLVATNDGKAVLSVDADGSIIVQNKKQFNTESIYDADCDELPYSIAKGATATGAISFPVVETAEFEYTIQMHSDDYDEEFEDVIFVINADSPSCKNNQEDDTKQEPTTDTNTSQNTGTTESANRYQEAVAEAQRWANAFYPTSRYFVFQLLTNPSLEQGFEPFTYDEASYAVNNAGIDWAGHALSYAISYVNNNSGPFSQWEIESLFDGMDFTNTEISYAVNNCGVDWSSEENDDYADEDPSYNDGEYAEDDETVDDSDAESCAGHHMDVPTCYAPSTCIYCGYTEGSPVDCQYVDGFCVFCGGEQS